MDNVYSVKEMAELCGVSKQTIQRAIKKCNIDVALSKAERGGKINRYSEESLKIIQKQLAKNQLNQEKITEREGVFSKAQICRLCGVTEKTFRRFLQTASMDTDVHSKTIAHNAKLYDKSVLETFQVWLMANQTKQGNSSVEVKSTVATSVKNELEKQDISILLVYAKQMAELNQSLVKNINNIQAKATEIDNRLSIIEKKIEERKALLPAPQITPRKHIIMLVKNYVSKTQSDYREVWSELYRQFAYRTNTNPSLCAMNRNMKTIEYIESINKIDVLESIALEIFG